MAFEDRQDTVAMAERKEGIFRQREQHLQGHREGLLLETLPGLLLRHLSLDLKIVRRPEGPGRRALRPEETVSKTL